MQIGAKKIGKNRKKILQILTKLNSLLLDIQQRISSYVYNEQEYRYQIYVLMAPHQV